MVQGRSLIVLAFAIVFGLAATFIANSYISGVEQRASASRIGFVNVIAARVPMDFGTEITSDNVRMISLPANAIPQGAYNSLSQLLPSNTRRVALRPISANEPILNSKISGQGGRASISAVLRPDMRATAVRVSDVAGVGGFVLPGDTVDVLITREPNGAPGQSHDQITDVLLQGVRVLATDQNANQSANQPTVVKTATLEVTQLDAQKLALAQQVGTLSLVLRNVAEKTEDQVKTVNIADLRDGVAHGATTPVAQPARPRPSRTTVHVHHAVSAPALQTIQIVRGVAPTSYEVSSHVE